MTLGHPKTSVIGSIEWNIKNKENGRSTLILGLIADWCTPNSWFLYEVNGFDSGVGWEVIGH